MILPALCLVAFGAAWDDEKAPAKKSVVAEAVEAIKPLPEVAIPDNPPPHEGAFFDLTPRIEPPDLVLVEVLEALPGRPITGERLVRPDGTISLGFYGDVHVAGLTMRQAKAKIIHYIRTYLPDHALGTIRFKEGGQDVEPLAKPGTRAKLPPNMEPPTDLDPEQPGLPENRNAPPKAEAPLPKRGLAGRPEALVDPIAKNSRPIERENRPEAKPPVDSRTRKPVEPANAAPSLPMYVYIDPADSSGVFVDVTKYNSAVYYVEGSVAAPGRLPWTGRDTVLDVIQYSGGLLAIADPTSIHLYRPAHAGKATKDYTIDYEQILKGDKRANLQLFPRDRLVIGRRSMK